MIERDLKKRKIESWYNIVQDRAEWRRIVNGEVSGVVRRGRRKGDEKKDKKEDASGVALEHRTEGLECPKCGKKYNTKKGGWYDKHLRECIVVKELVGLDGESDGDGGGKSSLVCPKCGKEYRSNRGGWCTKHLKSCGSSS